MRIDIDDILAPRGRPQRRDELADSAAKIAREQAAERVSGGLLLSGPPEATAKANQLSRSLGVPAPVIDGNIAAMERRQQTEQFVSTSMRFAGIASWASDPRNAAIGVDDWENLGLLGKTWETAKQFTTGALPSLASGLFGGLADNVESLIGAASDVADAIDPTIAILGFASDAINKVFGTDIRMDKDAQDTQDLLRRGRRKRQEALKVEANAWRPQSTSWIARDLLSGVESVPLTLTAILTRDPKAAAGVMGALSGAGSYGDARAQGLDLGASLAYGARQGFVEVITEKMPASKLLGDIASRTPFGKMIATQLAQEIPGEQAATFLQDLDEWVTLNPSNSLKEFALERPSAAAQTLLATIGGVGVTTGTISATTRALDTVTKVATKRAQSAQAEREGTVIDKLGDAAVNSKIRQRDPEAFAALIREMAEDGATDLYVDGEAVRAYMQSDSFDPEGPWAEYIDQSSEAFATGADVVIPVEKALTDLAGTPVWEALKNNMRFSPGGASRSEAEQFNAEVADLESMLPEEDVDARAEREFATARDNLAGSIATKLMDAGYTPSIARTHAELVATRYATRAARKGQSLTGKEYDDVEIRQVLPEQLALAQKNDGIDAVIEEMRRQGKGEGAGPSLAEFIAKRGGIEDAGGDLASMGADKWHVGKPGRRKLIKPFDKNQSSMLASDGPRDTQIERVFQAAIDAGYFPELEGVDRTNAADALDNNMLMEALGAELTGTKRFAKSIDTTLADNAAELDRILRERGVDPKTATRKQIRAALDEYSQQEEAAGYEQADTSSEAFKRWFGDSKVVDAKGRPLVVYHGTPADFEAFDKDRVGGRWDASIGLHFSDRPAEASLYAGREMGGEPDGQVIPAYLKIENPLIVETTAPAWRYADENRFELIRDIVQSRRKAEADDPAKRQADDDAIFAALTDDNPFAEVELAPAARPAAKYQPLKPYDGIIIKGSDGMNAIAFEPTQIKSVNNAGTFDPTDPRILNQSYGDGPRGRVIFNQGRTVIELFQSRNLSTFLHETSHMWLEELRFDAMDPDAPDQLKADWKLVEKWFSDNGHPIKDGVIPVEAHEMFARGGEQYFMEGKSPTGPLKGVFEQFRQWLNSIYRTVQALRTPLSPEIREVFDRLIATDQDLEFTAAEQSMSPLFKEAEWMSKTEYNAYVRLASDARTDARAMLIDKTTREIRARETKQYKSIAEGARAEVAESVDARPAFRAMAAMKQAPMDRQWVVDTMGDETALLLPRAVPPLYKNGGVHPDTIAEQSGFATGRDMIEALTAIEIAHRTAREEGDKRGLRERIIEEEVSEIMRQRYGDPLTDGSIEREALAAVHNEMAGEVIAAEVRVLARRTGNRPTPYAIARNWARNKVRTGIISQEAMPGAIQRHARAAAKAGREAEKAYLAQDIEEAFRFKQSQMIHNALLSEAKKALDEVDAARRRLDKIAARPTMKSVDQGYLEQAHGLLEAVDLKRRSMVQVDRKEAFEKWVNSRADGEEVLVPESFDWSGTNWTRMTVEALLGLDDTVKSIIHLGRLKQTLLDNKERRKFDDWKEEALAGIEATPGRKITNELGDPSRPVAGIFANLMKMEVFASEMDNAKADGVWQRLLVQRSTEAANYRDEMRDEVLNPIAEAYNALPTKTRDRMAERITIPEMPWRSADPNDPRNGTPQIRTRWDVVGMALNLGTSSNLDKLARGYGISEQVAEEIVRRELTKEEWDFVQGVWDSLNLLRPHIARVEREMTGVEPEWQEPREVDTPFGTLKGGYYPVKYDPAQSQQAEDYDNDAVADLFGKRSGVATSKGHTIARTDYAAPLLLSPEQVLFTHVEKIITRNAYAPWVRDVLKAVKQPSIRAAIDRKFGSEFRQQIEPWLRQQVREGIVNESGARFAEKFLRSARVNLTVVAMGLRWSTGLAQTIGLGNSIGRIGFNNVRRGMQRMLSNPSKAAEFVFARSPEMERRNESMNRDVAEAFRQMRSARMSGSSTLRKAKAAQAKAQAFAFWHIGMIDRYVVSIPTWLGAYEKATREGMDDVKASAYADKMVRLSQGSGREKDLSAWQSNQTSEGLKFFTMFYTPFNVLLNTQWEAGRAARRGDWRKASSLAFWFMIATPLLDAMLAGDTPWDDDDEEGWATWLARNVGFYQFAGIPIVRDATNYAERKMIGQFATFSPGPIGRIFDATEDAATLAWDATLGEDEVSDRWLRTAIETPGYFLGLPTGQVAQTGNFLKDVSLGEADPEGFWDWYTGLTKGKIEE